MMIRKNEQVFEITARLNNHQVEVTDPLLRKGVLDAGLTYSKGDFIKVVNGIITGKTTKFRVKNLVV